MSEKAFDRLMALLTTIATRTMWAVVTITVAAVASWLIYKGYDPTPLIPLVKAK
ncbi:hypothetical protein [Nonomuraea sp. JJY05]|uniref:hypothetical protein n=1 Tax=Nonomuraea sp. JJY05 TaxID=3350255 RepID=UPI00373E0B0C